MSDSNVRAFSLSDLDVAHVTGDLTIDSCVASNTAIGYVGASRSGDRPHPPFNLPPHSGTSAFSNETTRARAMLRSSLLMAAGSRTNMLGCEAAHNTAAKLLLEQ